MIVWAVFELTPPTSRDLVKESKDLASNTDTDTNLDAIISEAQARQATNSANVFANLKTAVGANDLRHYFPDFKVDTEENPNAAILNRIQRSATGKIRLGLNLQGGTEFLLALGTNQVKNVGTNAAPAHPYLRLGHQLAAVAGVAEEALAGNPLPGEAAHRFGGRPRHRRPRDLRRTQGVLSFRVASRRVAVRHLPA